MDGWYYRVAGNDVGPVPMMELQRLMRAGQLGPAVAVWREGMPAWVPAAQVPGLVPSEDGLQFLVPTSRTSKSALAAGYLGLFGLLVFPLAPAGLVVGILAVRDLRRHPEKNGWGRAITGIVLGGFMTLVMLLWIVAIVVGKK